ncbi:MAG TPA: DNA polymerase II [bacterium]|nr:DNA polymerase II [bacterium]
MPRGFLLHPTYRVESGRPVVLVRGILEDGRSLLIRDDRSVPRFWIRREDAARARDLGARVTEPPRALASMDGHPVAAVEVGRPQDAPPIRDLLIEHGILTYEADVRFAMRWLIERGIRGTFEVTGEDRPGEGVEAVFVNPEVKPADWTPKLRALSIDIETDPRARRVLSIALAGCGVSDVMLLTPPGWSCPDGAEPFATEREMLEAFVRRVSEIDPDVLTGWNVIDFDLAVLDRVATAHRVRLTLGRGPDPLQLRPSQSPRGGSEARVPGRLVLDGSDLLRGAFLRFESYSLDSVSREVLGVGKTMHGTDRAGAILKAFREDREKLVEYNRVDAQLVLDVLDKLQLLELTVERSRLTGMPPDRVAASIASFDFLYLSELGRRGLVAPSVRPWAAPEELGGGHVLEPVAGLHRNVVVLDFKSLYPSLIRTFQIDPLGYVEEPDPGDDVIVAPNRAAFRREPGILPGILDELFPRRMQAKAAGDRAGDMAIKILMNSFYGVLGASGCRFASPALANAITGFGREILLWTKAQVEHEGHRVLYGDTDSLFVESREESAGDARAFGANLAKRLNEALAEHVKQRWRVESKLEVEFERLYRRLLLPVLRGGTEGARKRYAGLAEHEDGPKLVFTGLEAVRRDWTALAKQVQRELYGRLFDDRPVDEYLHDVVAELRAGRHDDLLVYRKGLRKNLREYTASTPPHVAAARKMKERTGWVVEYVITTDGPEPAAERKSPIDHEHYVQKQIRPVAEPVLTLLHLEFDRVIGDDSQLELF